MHYSSITSLDQLAGKRVSLFLSAGGNRAAFQWGVWKQLKSAGVEVGSIWGVSGGSLASLLISMDDMVAGDKIIFNVDNRDIFSGSPIFRAMTLRPSFYTMKPLENLIHERIGSMDSLKIPVHTIAYSLNEERTKVFCTEDSDFDTFAKAVRASSSIPVVFDPVNINGEKFVDGGVQMWTPLKHVIDDPFDPEVVLVITTQPRMSEVRFNDVRPRWWKILGHTVDALTSRVYNADFEKFEIINRAVEQMKRVDRNIEFINSNGQPYSHYNYLCIEPDKNLPAALDFSREAMLELHHEGTRIGTQVVKELTQT